MVRIKHRYLLFNILYPKLPAQSQQASKSLDHNLASLAFQSPTPDYIDAGLLVKHLKTHIGLLFGDYGVGVAQTSLKMVYFSAATSTAILRVPRNHHQLVWAALTHMTELPASRRGTPGKPCVVRVVRVSGTIRKAEEELIRRARRDVVRAKMAGDGKSASWLPSAVNAGKGAAAVSDQVDESMMSMEDFGESEDDSE